MAFIFPTSSSILENNEWNACHDEIFLKMNKGFHCIHNEYKAD